MPVNAGNSPQGRREIGDKSNLVLEKVIGNIKNVLRKQEVLRKIEGKNTHTQNVKKTAVI